MTTKNVFRLLAIAAVLIASLWTGGSAAAQSACGTSYTVRSGDTLGIIAGRCSTTIAALRLANPNIGIWIYAGQNLVLPGAFSDNGNGYATYIVTRGETLKSLAARFGTSIGTLVSLNGIQDYNLIYEGQRLTLPSASGVPSPSAYPQPRPMSAGTYTVQWGDTLRKISARFNVTLADLEAVNPQVRNPNVIFIGQVVYVPASASLYTVRRGDSLRMIAGSYGTSVESLLALNPQIWNANLIYAGEVIRVW
jgi:LysM repeat protein